jgi:hypothetical protein
MQMSVKIAKLAITVADITDFSTVQGKVFVDSLDTTLGFLSPKIAVTSNLVKTVLNAGANEQVQLDVNLSSLDGRYVKRSPSGENQTVLPLTDNVPLILKSFAGAASDTLEVQSSGGANMLKVGPTGAVTVLPSAAAVPLTVQEPSAGGVDILDLKNAAGTIIASVGSTGATFVQPSTDAVALTVQQSGASVFADLMDVKDNTGAILGKILNTGQITWLQQIKIAPTTSVIPFAVTGASPALDLVDIRDSTGALVFEILPPGGTVIAPTSGTPLSLQVTSAGPDILDLKNSAGTLVWKVLTSGATAITPSTDVVPLTAQVSTGGVSDIVDLKDNMGNIVYKIDSVGRASYGAIAIGASTVLRISPPTTLTSPASPFAMVEFDPNSFTLPSNNFVFRFLFMQIGSAGTVNAGATTGGTVQGLTFTPAVNPGTGGLTNFTPVLISTNPTTGGGGTITSYTGLLLSVLGNNNPVTTLKGISVTATSTGTVTTIVGVDITVTTASNPTTSIGLRNNASLHMTNVLTKTAAYTMLTSDFTVLADATAAAFTVTLPPAQNKGQILFVKKIDSSVNVVTVAAAGADTIEGSASVALSTQNSAQTLISDGVSKWYRVSTI